MLNVYLLIYVPIILFVLAFLYETYLSVVRLFTRKDQHSYVDSTWEITHTILVFGVVMMLMLFTRNIDELANVLFWPAFLAITFLMIRGATYIQIFYIRKNSKHRNWVDWTFMLSHFAAAVTLVWAVLAFTLLAIGGTLHANIQFVPAFLVGLAAILAVVIGPITYLYFLNKNK